MSEIVMPRLSDTMEEGTILRWLKAEGDVLGRGEELVEIETDKATMTYESDQAGTLHLLAAEGETLAVGQPIATVGEPAGAAPGATAGDSAGAVEEEMPAPDGPGSGSQRATSPDGGGGPAAAAPPESSDRASERVRASPLARRIAREEGVELSALAGTGPGGRIVKADVLAAEVAADTSARAAVPAGAAGAPAGEHDTGQASGAPAGEHDAGQAGGAPADEDDAGQAGGALAGVATAKGQTRELELSRTQQTVARRMAESKATIPDFTLQIEVDMEQCVALRTQLKALATPGGSGEEQTPTYNDMVVKACALALREHPLANGSYRDGRLQLHSRINVGVAVAAEDSLVVPTIFDADAKAVGEIARETRALAARVRDGSITPPELGGGTFTISNLGMFGVRSFTAIINPPQAAIMSVGSLEQRAVVREGDLLARHTMSLTLVCDHRILYGAPAASFLARVRELLEAPASLTL